MKQGLIMEGGGMSGVFTAGVMDVLMKNNIKFERNNRRICWSNIWNKY